MHAPRLIIQILIIIIITCLNRMTISVIKTPINMHWAKRHIFATDFARIRIGTRGVYDNILKYSRTHDATYT